VGLHQGEPKGQFRVWLWNGEDSMDELNRRIAAAMQHYGLCEADMRARVCARVRACACARARA